MSKKEFFDPMSDAFYHFGIGSEIKFVHPYDGDDAGVSTGIVEQKKHTSRANIFTVKVTESGGEYTEVGKTIDVTFGNVLEKGSKTFEKGGSVGKKARKIARPNRDIAKDKTIKALHAGKRTTDWGTTYVENRVNRSDKNRTKKFEKGGSTDSVSEWNEDAFLTYAHIEIGGFIVDTIGVPLNEDMSFEYGQREFTIQPLIHNKKGSKTKNISALFIISDDQGRKVGEIDFTPEGFSKGKHFVASSELFNWTGQRFGRGGEVKNTTTMTDKEKEKLTRISRLLDNNQVNDPELRAKLQAERDMLEEKMSQKTAKKETEKPKKEDKPEPKAEPKKPAKKVKRTKPKVEKKEAPKAKKKVSRVKPKKKAEPKKAVRKVSRIKPKKAKETIGKARTIRKVKYLNEKGKTKKSVDKKITALHPGKRKSKFGTTYYEYRANRADLNRTKKLEKGGEIDDIKVGDTVNLPEIKFKSQSRKGEVQFERVNNGVVKYIENDIFGVYNPKTQRIHQVTKDQIEKISK